MAGAKVVDDPDLLVSVTHDRAGLAPAGRPAALVKARDADDVANCLRFANERCIPVVTRAAGTGLAGAANALNQYTAITNPGSYDITGTDPDAAAVTISTGAAVQAQPSSAPAKSRFRFDVTSTKFPLMIQVDLESI